MPDLPILTVSQAHYDILVGAFPGSTPAEKAASYRAFSFNNLIDYVLQQQQVAIIREVQTQADAQIKTRIQSVADSLPPKQNFRPPTPPITP